jgi:hypothetical protein
MFTADIHACLHLEQVGQCRPQAHKACFSPASSKLCWQHVLHIVSAVQQPPAISADLKAVYAAVSWCLLTIVDSKLMVAVIMWMCVGAIHAISMVAVLYNAGGCWQDGMQGETWCMDGLRMEKLYWCLRRGTCPVAASRCGRRLWRGSRQRHMKRRRLQKRRIRRRYTRHSCARFAWSSRWTPG